MPVFSTQIQYVLILLGILQGVILLSILLSSSNRKKPANKVLIAFLLLVTLTLVGNIFFVKGLIQQYPHMGLLMDDMFLLYGPLLYLYVGATLNIGILFQKRLWLHFVLPAIHVLTMTEYMLMSPQEFYNAMVKGVWQYPFDQAAAIVSIAIYLVLSWRMILTGQSSGNKKFLQIIFWVVLAGLILWANQFCVHVFHFGSATISQYTNPWTFFPLITIAMGYFALSKSTFFETEARFKAYSGSNIDAEEINGIQKRLEQFMEEERPFLDQGLTLSLLASKLNVQAKDLSRVINQQFGLNFFDFVNRYRVDEFKQLATPERLKTHKIIGIAFDVGFNSKSAFNKAFKRLEGRTPTEYLKDKSGLPD